MTLLNCWVLLGTTWVWEPKYPSFAKNPPTSISKTHHLKTSHKRKVYNIRNIKPQDSKRRHRDPTFSKKLAALIRWSWIVYLGLLNCSLQADTEYQTGTPNGCMCWQAAAPCTNEINPAGRHSF
jgi:hypothetical protein